MKYLIHKGYRIYKIKPEDITRFISNSPKMLSKYNLPMRPDVVARTIFIEIHWNDNSETKEIRTYSLVEVIPNRTKWSMDGTDQ